MTNTPAAGDMIVQTITGRYLSLIDPHTYDFDIEEIAHALSHICRFGGHTRAFYSVAQHSVLVSQLVPQQVAAGALLHDAAEAFIGDVVRPLKSQMPEYRAMEQRLQSAIEISLGVRSPARYGPFVRIADLTLLATERRDLMTEQEARWPILDGVKPLRKHITPLPPERAKELFLRRWQEVSGG